MANGSDLLSGPDSGLTDGDRLRITSDDPRGPGGPDLASKRVRRSRSISLIILLALIGAALWLGTGRGHSTTASPPHHHAHHTAPPAPGGGAGPAELGRGAHLYRSDGEPRRIARHHVDRDVTRTSRRGATAPGGQLGAPAPKRFVHRHVCDPIGPWARTRIDGSSAPTVNCS